MADAYGWPWPLADEEILERVVALNAARAAEEANGTIRWLRPEYQVPRQKGEGRVQNEQPELGLTEGKAPDLKTGARAKRGQRFTKPSSATNAQTSAQSEIGNRKSKIPWPSPLAQRAQAVEAALAAELATRFARAKAEDVAEILDTLAALGRARRGDTQGTYLR